MTPFNLFALNMRLATMAMEAQTVITLRLLGLSGAIPARRGENTRMVEEKTSAMIDAWTAALKASLAGQRPDQVFAAGLAPIGRKVRSNRKRLMR